MNNSRIQISSMSPLPMQIIVVDVMSERNDAMDVTFSSWRCMMMCLKDV